MLPRIRELFRSLMIYGVGDVATTIISFLLLPLYVRYLSPNDYGVLSLLLTTEVVTKILFRWGIDASFMRLYYDCPDQPARQRLASTQFWFLAAVNGTLLLIACLSAPALGRQLFHSDQYDTTLRLVLVNTFLVGFTFIPFSVMRIEGQPRTFMTLTFLRSLATLVLRLVFVIGMRLGVLGIVLADIVVTSVFMLVLSRWFAALIRPVFSKALLAESLGFGLPRVPHGVAHQVIAVADRYILTRFVTLHEVGLYSIGASFGLAMKLFLSAFEYAWAPFYFGTMSDPNAKQIFRRVTTYGLAVLILLASGLCAIAGDLVAAMTTTQFHRAAGVVPWVALGVALQGVYLLTSIGLNITKQTKYYPLATGIAAGTSVTLNLLLIPALGITGAAVANTAAYGVLALVSWHFAQKFYPMTYERGRIARLLVAGVVAYLAARLPSLPVHHAVAFVLRGAIVVAVYPTVLLLTGFFVPGERQTIAVLMAQFRRRKTVESSIEATDMAGELVASPSTDDAVEVGDERAEVRGA